MFGRRACLAVVLPLALATALAAVLTCRPPAIGVSLLGLIGREAERMPAFVRENAAREIDVVISSTNRVAAGEVAAQIRTAFKTLVAIPPGAVEFLRQERAGLVSPEVATLLETHEGRAKIARRARRRLYANPTPPLLGFADDPFFLVDSFLPTLAQGASTVETNGVTHVLVKLDAIDGIPDLARFVRPDVTVRLCGTPVHAARAEARCRREVNALSLFSIVFIGLLAVFVFRSLRWIPYLAGSLAVATLAGALTLTLAFRDIHLMSLVFGTTILGLVVDYSFHWLLSDPGREAATRHNLAISFLTTEISLVPLMVSSVPILAQSSFFLGAGLAGALVYVLVAYPRAIGQVATSAPRTVPRIGVRVLCLFVVALAFVGFMRLAVKTDATSLYRAPADLLAAEQIKAMFHPFDWSALPSRTARTRTLAHTRALYAEHAAELARELSLEHLRPPSEPRFDFMPPRQMLDDMLAGWTRETLLRLAWAMVCMLVAVAVFFRRKALRVFAPSVFALLAVAGILSLCGVTLNLFHLLAGFLLAGMGVDYAVFLLAEDASMRSVVCSLLTSMVGFGVLVFVSMPVAVSFGQALGLGLPIVFMAALALKPAPRACVEQAASPLGLETLWLVYRVFGLRFLHVFARGVALCAWVFSSAVRRASPSAARVQNFASSLADRLVVMANGRDLPQVVAEEHPDARAFVNDVQSGRGVFILFPHIGAVETLIALGTCGRMFHGWMDVGRTSVFTRFYLAHANQPRVTIHSIADFGMGAVFETGDWLDAGECVLMAGDRGDGAFRLAASFEHPIYFVACVYEGRCRYRAVVRRLPSARKELKTDFCRWRDDLAARYATQCYTFA